MKYRDEAIILSTANTADGRVLRGYSSVSSLNDLFSDSITNPSVSVLFYEIQSLRIIKGIEYR